MFLREPCLPPGWYPGSRAKIGEFLEPFSKNGNSRSAIAPHAGWYYSGSCAAKAVSSLNSKAETVVVIGGHLPGGMPFLVAEEDAVKTPLGNMTIDVELRNGFREKFETRQDLIRSDGIRPDCIRPDRYQDNTVEVLLPMVHYFFPKAELLWLRFPASLQSFEAGKLLAETAVSLGRNIAVLASTDLTHYGDNYGFSPKGRGKPALEWVKNVNDAAFIGAVLAGNPAEALKKANEDYSACSAGAVLGALGFAEAMGLSQRKLLEYCTSAGIDEGRIPDSFVGYAAISFE